MSLYEAGGRAIARSIAKGNINMTAMAFFGQDRSNWGIHRNSDG
jgi:hypothetical protein